jgi:hypothetical protein
MTGNIPWNQSQPPGAPPVEKSWKAAEVIPVQCNIHPWMHGWFVVVKGPYAPPTQRQLHHQQRAARKLHRDGVAGRVRHPNQKVTVAAGAAATANFTFKAK